MSGSNLQVESATVPVLLSQDQLCRWLGKSSAWAERGRMAGYGPRFVKVGRSVRYRTSDVLAWLEANVRRSTCDAGD